MCERIVGAWRVSGLGKLVADVTTDSEGLTLRLDDERDDAFWAEVRLPLAQLKALVQRVEEHDARLDRLEIGVR